MPNPDTVNSTVDDDVQQLIRRHGKDTFLEAVKRQTKAKLGRKAELDWLRLVPYIQADETDWLEGRDPIQLRSHYSIAQQFAKEHPGYNQSATATRVLRKLSDKRRWTSLTTAWLSSFDGVPYTAHLRVLELMAEIDERWAQLHSHALYFLEQYRAKLGEPPEKMSFSDIRKGGQNALTQLPSSGTLGGVLSALLAEKSKP